MTNSTTLGTLGTVRDNSYTYGAGSSEVFVSFVMYGLTFTAHHFVRTDVKMDVVNLYIERAGEWCNEYVRTFTTATCRVSERAVHLIAVARSQGSSEFAERVALLECA